MPPSGCLALHGENPNQEKVLNNTFLVPVIDLVMPKVLTQNIKNLICKLPLKKSSLRNLC